MAEADRARLTALQQGTLRASSSQSMNVDNRPPPGYGVCGRAFQYRAQLDIAAELAGADREILAALLAVEASGERAVSTAGALGLMQLMPDKFLPGDDPFSVTTNLLRAAQHVASLQRVYGSPDQVAAAYFGAINSSGHPTRASDGNVDGVEYVRRFQAARACVQLGHGRTDLSAMDLVSPIGTAITSTNISFGFLDQYGPTLAMYIRGAHGVQRYGTRHLAWDLIIPGAPSNGRGSPIFAPMSGRIVRTSDAAGGPFGIWLESPERDLRARLMHMDALAPSIASGSPVKAGEWLGVLGGQGTEEFPHLHLSLERLSTGERLDPAPYFLQNNARPLADVATGDPSARSPLPLVVTSADDQALQFRVAGLGEVSNPKVWAHTIVWEVLGPHGRTVRAYDLGIGQAVQIGDPTGEQASPSIFGDVVVWLDTRHAADVPKSTTDASASTDWLADVYAYDLRTGQERRLTTVPSRYGDLVIGPDSVAWVRRDQLGSTLEIYDLATGELGVVDRGRGRLGELAISDRVLAWIDHPSETGEDGDLRGYELATGRLVPIHLGPTGRPVVMGPHVFWEESVDGSAGRLIRALNVETGEERTIAPDLRPRRGLTGSDGVLLWEEPTDDGRSEVRVYGFASNQGRSLGDRRSDGGGGIAIGHGTALLPAEPGELMVAYLPDWELTDGHFYTEQAGASRSGNGLGFSVTNEGGIPFWDEFRRLGGAAVLGRPVSGRITLADGLAYQATERALLQWRPDLGRAVLADALDILDQQGYGEWLHDRRQIPRSTAHDGLDGRDLRLDWLTDLPIRELFLANPDPTRLDRWTPDDAVTLYGLPTSKPEDFGPFVAQRFQRAVFQRWKSEASQPPQPDRVTLVRIGTIFCEIIYHGARTDDR